MGALGALGSIHLKVPPYLAPLATGEAVAAGVVVEGLAVAGIEEAGAVTAGAVTAGDDAAGVVAAGVGAGVLVLQPVMIKTQTNRITMGTNRIFILAYWYLHSNPVILN
jgi:hypothetical protein